MVVVTALALGVIAGALYFGAIMMILKVFGVFDDV